MSIKVYEAYKLKSSKDLWSFAKDAQLKAQENVRKELSKLYKNLKDHIIQSEYYVENLPNYKTEKSKQRFLLSCTRDYVYKQYVEQLSSNERNLFDLDFSISFHEFKNNIYFIPYYGCLFRNCTKFLKKDPRVEEYSYWNNSDPPKNILSYEWKKRGKVWDQICNNWQPALHLDIMKKDIFYKVALNIS